MSKNQKIRVKERKKEKEKKAKKMGTLITAHHLCSFLLYLAR